MELIDATFFVKIENCHIPMQSLTSYRNRSYQWLQKVVEEGQ